MMAIDHSSEWDVCEVCGQRHPPFEPGMYMVGDDIDVAAILVAHMRSDSKCSLLIDLIDSDKQSSACKCHERDGSYVCDYCYSQGFRGHMQ